MREIKFRAFIESEQRIFGVLKINWINGEIRQIGYASAIVEYYGVAEIYHTYTDRFILMQYTGLNDKNGNEIYEGDILSFDGNITADNSFGMEPNGYIYNEDSKHEVIWDTVYACWDLKHNEDEDWKYRSDTRSLMLDSDAIEIIGNVYENHELLKPKETK